MKTRTQRVEVEKKNASDAAEKTSQNLKIYYKFSPLERYKLFIEANSCTHIVGMNIELIIRFAISSDILNASKTRRIRRRRSETRAFHGGGGEADNLIRKKAREPTKINTNYPTIAMELERSRHCTFRRCYYYFALFALLAPVNANVRR